jgi:7-cyano-7-deazaguanine synthase
MSYPKNFRRAIMATGGMDSTTLLYNSVMVDNVRPLVVTVDYGHEAFTRQVEMLNHHVQRLGLDPVVVLQIPTLPFQRTGDGAGLFSSTPSPGAPVLQDPGADDPVNTERLFHDQEMRYKEMFVEGRNTIMVAYALAWASSYGVDELQVGYVRGEAEWKNHRSYKMITGDNSPQFVDAMNALTLYGFSHQVRIRAPYYEQRMDKNAVAALGQRLGVPWGHTHSCYWSTPCGVCDNCKLRAEALKSVGQFSD